MSIKVFSVCLWGDDPTYNIGAIKNAELCLVHYPDFEYWIYIHKDSVPSETVKQLQQMSHVKIIYKTGYDANPTWRMTWRFETIDNPDVELMISRDTDTRILKREVVATQEWIKSGKLFHIMRDHPEHGTAILGGMFGARKIPSINSWKVLMNDAFQGRGGDQRFLTKYIYPQIIDNCMIHANFCRYEKEKCLYFTEPYDNQCSFVGMHVYHDESLNDNHMKNIRKFVNMKT